ncbi:hypothetical protein SBA3_2290033 [Candidatus Sulfopaludibacter sp. SbA3]|nr:hypothetical protein SBA3_2290033 [Candidatus Sulfopaludibacter sp. SbA3]
MKNRRLVTPSVKPPVALADRRQDRRRYRSLCRFSDRVRGPLAGNDKHENGRDFRGWVARVCGGPRLGIFARVG